MSFKEKIKSVFKNADPAKKDEVIAAVKDAFNDIETSQPTSEQKYMDATLADGTVIMIEPGVEVDAAVTVAVDGEIVPVEDATHELADGTMIRTEGGIIVEVISPEGEAVEEEVMSDEATKTESVPSPKTVIERTEVERKFNQLKKEVEERDAKIEALEKSAKEMSEKFEAAEKSHLEKLEDMTKKLEETIEAVLDFSAVAPTEKVKTSVSTTSKLKSIKRTFRRN